MRSFRHRLPPLSQLLIFESAARHLSFTRAAQELHVTQSGVSKQIKQLEEYLGFALFIRQGKSVLLTTRGHELHENVSASFNYMADKVEGLVAYHDRETVTIAANVGMSKLWLSPILDALSAQDRLRDIQIKLITSDMVSDILADEIDIAVVYGASHRFGWHQELLFEEEIYPVASPAYLAQHQFDSDNFEALLQQDLLEYARKDPGWSNWQVWLEKIGLDAQAAPPSRTYDNYGVLIDAVLNGAGITLGTHNVLDEQLRSGKLVRLTSHSYKSGKGYYLARNMSRQLNNSALRLYDWILGSAITPP